MNRKNFLGHLALALAIIAIAALAGWVRHHRYQAGHRFIEAGDRAATSEPADTEDSQDRADVLVRFRPGTPLSRIRQLVREHHDRIKDQIETVSGLSVVENENGENAAEVLSEFRALPEVEYAEPDYMIRLDSDSLKNPDSRSSGTANAAEPNDPRFSEQWSLNNTGQNNGKPHADIHALGAWARTTGSEDVVVAVLDSGVDYNHPDLSANMWQRPDNMDSYQDNEMGAIDDEDGFSAIDDDPMDENGHGTHCAGVIGAEGDNNEGIVGVNWHVQIMPLKFMSADGYGTTAAAIECINYVIERKRAGVNVRIISASWGSTQKSRALEDAIREAGEEGILFVAASGNSSADADRSPQYPASYDLPNVVSVAALDRNDTLATFSNYGAKSVHIAAPGVEILSTWLGGEFREASGTSMATPEVAGVAALILAREPKLNVKALRDRLLDSVDKLDSLSGKVSSGGRLNAARAVGAE